MLDELLGRAELKDRIEDLESEKEDLRARLEAEEDRRSAAVRDRQDAEERVNRLEDRVAELEDRVERSESGGTPTPSLRAHRRVSGKSARRLLERLESVTASPDGAFTATVTGHEPLPDPVSEALGDRAAALQGKTPMLVCYEDEGVVIAALRPPLFPEPIERWDRSFELHREWFLPEAQDRHALGVVRSDLFALGIYEGAERIELRGFESDVRSDHSKGGFSQRRFERRRDHQIEDHLRAVRDVLEDAPRPLYLVGGSGVLTELEDLADVTSASDATGNPESALAAAREDFWTTSLWVP